MPSARGCTLRKRRVVDRHVGNPSEIEPAPLGQSPRATLAPDLVGKQLLDSAPVEAQRVRLGDPVELPVVEVDEPAALDSLDDRALDVGHASKTTRPAAT